MRKFFTLTFLFTFAILNAQVLRVGLQAGAAAYRGDVGYAPEATIKQMNLSFGVYGTYFVRNFIGLRGQAYFAQLTGNERAFPASDFHAKRGYSFETTLVELAIMPEIRPFKIGHVNFIGFAGVAASYYLPRTNYNELSNEPHHPNIAEDKDGYYSLRTLAVPVGGGVEFFINDKIAVGLEIIGRFTLSDYLDGVHYTGNQRSKDFYYTGGITLSKTIGEVKGTQKSIFSRSNLNRNAAYCPRFY
jgi:hypothetical protein